MPGAGAYNGDEHEPGRCSIVLFPDACLVLSSSRSVDTGTGIVTIQAD